MSKRVISFHYTLTDTAGQVLDSSRGAEPLSFIEGVGQIIPGLEREILTLRTGDTKMIQVSATEAYGHRDEELVISVPRDQFGEQEVSVGDQFQAGQEPESPTAIVVDITDSHIVLDANHPLAGVDMVFDVEVTGVRDATADELSHGHIHGPGGHHH